MKYTVSIEIARQREEVAQLLADPTHLPKWLRGLVLHAPLNGVHGQVGTKSRVVMQMGQQKFEGIETITRREPAELRGIPKGSVVHFELAKDKKLVALIATWEKNPSPILRRLFWYHQARLRWTGQAPPRNSAELLDSLENVNPKFNGQ